MKLDAMGAVSCVNFEMCHAVQLSRLTGLLIHESASDMCSLCQYSIARMLATA